MTGWLRKMLEVKNHQQLISPKKPTDIGHHNKTQVLQKYQQNIF